MCHAIIIAENVQYCGSESLFILSVVLTPYRYLVVVVVVIGGGGVFRLVESRNC